MKMRRSDRQITDPAAIQAILDACTILRLALVADGKPYVVPLHFGYTGAGERLTLYFHTAREGRLPRALLAGSPACFEMDIPGEIIRGELACNFSQCYASIIGEGTPHAVTEDAEKRAALDALMDHVAGPGPHIYADAALRATAVWALPVDSLTAKRRGS